MLTGHSRLLGIWLTRLLIASWSIIPVAAQGNLARIAPDLAYEIQDGSQDTYYGILVQLRDQVDLASFEQQSLRNQPSREDRVRLLLNTLQDKAKQSQLGLLERLRRSPQADQQSIASFWIANIIYVRAQAPLIWQLTQDPDVNFVDWDRPIYRHRTSAPEAAPVTPNGVEPGLVAINAPAMWRLGYTGYGRKVLVLDDGQDTEHPALRNQFAYNQEPLRQAYGSLVTPDYCTEHGTHVAGTIIGLNRLTRDTIGVAFNARWMGAPLPLRDQNGETCKLLGSTIVNTFQALQWALNPDGNNNTADDIPDVINNSWGNPAGNFNLQDCFTSTYRNIFTSLDLAGIAVVFSAGNEGPDSLTISFPSALSMNTVLPFSVGAVNGNQSSTPIASFSSRGPSQCNPTGGGPLNIKPEVVAPGLGVRSASPGGKYVSLSGTSMAAPHVSGAILLLKEAFPQVSGRELALALYQSARDLGANGEDNIYGRGIIDVKAAYDYLVAKGIQPTPPISSPNDVVLLDVETRLQDCGGRFGAIVTVENAGTDPLTAFNLVIRRATTGQVLGNALWSGNLPPKGRTQYTVIDIPLPVGSYDIQVSIETPNGFPDARALNNSLKKQINVTNLAILPTVTTTTPVICPGGQALLTSDYQGQGSIHWHDRISGGSPVSIGPSLLTGALTKDTVFYAELNFDGKVGKVDNSGTGAYSETSEPLIFDCFAPFTLKSVVVYVETVGPRGIILRAPDGSIQQRIVNVTKTGQNRLTLNFQVEPGTGYRLERSLGKGMYINTTGTQFPYETPGILRITQSDNTNSATYPYFYDWEINYAYPCGRTPLRIAVPSNGPNLNLSFQPLNSTVNLVNGEAPVSFSAQANNASNFSWNFGDGQTSTNATPTNIYRSAGEYPVILTASHTEGCSATYIGKVTVGTATATQDLPRGGRLVLYPNPASEMVTIEADLPEIAEISWQLIDPLGRTIQQSVWGSLRQGQLTIPVYQLPKGMYTLLFTVDGYQVSRRLTIQ
ncbi:MAG: S8 family serine peptidase [Lewinellaceae bacterium]|nr:S8 family serine peptidase [Lewinellaceae bacterium]